MAALQRANMTGFFSQIAEITDHLYLCGYQALNPARLKHKGITHVINVTMDVPCVRIPGVDVTQYKVNDVPHANLSVYFDRCADKIHQVYSQRGKTLVHCIAGVSRSATLCIAYLMKYKKVSLRDAYEHVKKRRPFIRPNVGFWRQMIDYEKKLHGRNTVRMVSSSLGIVPDVYHEETKNTVWTTSYQSAYSKP